MLTAARPQGVVIAGATPDGYLEILTPQALAFLAALARRFEPRRLELLQARAERQRRFDAGERPAFLPDTQHIRDAGWRVGAIPADLRDRRVEITGPTDRKMIINALNSGASVFMADFEDANAPTWANLMEGQVNLRDAVRRTIAHTGPDGREYRLGERTATLIVRPRGWHLIERHLLIDGTPVAGALFDFALFFFHNARELLARGSGPYVYLPKLESHHEARLWNDVFVAAQAALGLPVGTIKATVLIETLPAAFEMDEILYELREHCVGLNIGRWDYLFSCIKTLRANRDFCLADRSAVTMMSPFLRAYALLLIRTCHPRGAYAMGGMAAQIPIRDDPEANAVALAKVRADKEREATDGCDGTWVAHPGLVGIARAVFDQHMPAANQLDRLRDEVMVTADDLLDFRPAAPITEAGVRNNIAVGIQYLGAWLAGNGCVPVYHLMEDAATAEISRAQLWQWLRSPHGILDDGRRITRELVSGMIPEELARVRRELGEDAWAAGRYEEAAQLFESLTMNDTFVEFLTLPAYEALEKVRAEGETA